MYGVVAQLIRRAPKSFLGRCQFKSGSLHFSLFGAVVQLVRIPDCGSGDGGSIPPCPFLTPSFNGRTPGFDPGNLGSNPRRVVCHGSPNKVEAVGLEPMCWKFESSPWHYAPVGQLEEPVDLKFTKCRFKSDLGHFLDQNGGIC